MDRANFGVRLSRQERILLAMPRHRPDVPTVVPFLMQQDIAQLAAIQQRSANRASDKVVRFALYRLSANDLAGCWPFCHGWITLSGALCSTWHR
jgi:hypothetical protein